MTGVLSPLLVSFSGTPNGYWVSLSECPPGSTLRTQTKPSVNYSLSVSFYPPSQEYVPLEEVVKKFPDFAYQLFFADPATTKKIEDNVISLILSNPAKRLIRMPDRNLLQVYIRRSWCRQRFH